MNPRPMLRRSCLNFFATSATAVYLSLHAVAAPLSQAVPTSDTIKAQGGTIRITPLFHASVQIEYAGKVIDVDPVSAANYPKKADLILITHAHPDHFDQAAIKKVAATFVHIAAPRSITKQLQPNRKQESIFPLDNGSTLDFHTNGSKNQKINIHIEAVPMYNLVRGPKPGQKFHPKGWGNGYIITLGGKRLYLAGDTEATPEMQHLKHIDIAFLPMNLPFTMTPQEAAKGARAFMPKIVYPYHYRYPFNKPNTNAQQFAAALKGSGIEVRLREWYPAAAVAHAAG